MYTVKDFYDAINSFADFSTAMKWDNCGILVGDPSAGVSRALTALDITLDVVTEAHNKGCELIISHHPVIFSPIKSIYSGSVAALLLQYGISAICVHTPFDLSESGMNLGLYNILSDKLGFCGSEPLESVGELSIGRIYDLSAPICPEKAAQIIGSALGCTAVRYSRGGRPIHRLAVSSGAGADMWKLAMEKGADGIASGDFKHSSFIDAGNCSFTIIDCGHFHTERIFGGIINKLLQPYFPKAVIEEAESCVDPVQYCILPGSAE